MGLKVLDRGKVHFIVGQRVLDRGTTLKRETAGEGERPAPSHLWGAACGVGGDHRGAPGSVALRRRRSPRLFGETYEPDREPIRGRDHLHLIGKDPQVPPE
jgi:hypothetical protein